MERITEVAAEYEASRATTPAGSISDPAASNYCVSGGHLTHGPCVRAPWYTTKDPLISRNVPRSGVYVVVPSTIQFIGWNPNTMAGTAVAGGANGWGNSNLNLNGSK